MSTIRNGGYAFFNGTSMAAPHVAGVAALMLAVEGTLSVAQLKAGILDHVDPLDTLAGVTVTGGRLNADAAVRWVVAQPNFRLDVTSAGAQTVTAGGATAYTLTVVPVNGFVDTVTFDLSGLPATATATFTPASVSGGGDVTLQVLTSPATPAGSYALTVTGGSGTLAHSAPLTLTVLPGTPDFRVTVAPASLQVSREGSAQATVTVETFAGWDKDVKVSVDGVPPHTKARLAPAMVDAPGTALLTIEAAKAAPAGRFTLTLTGRSAGGSRTATLELEVLP